MKQTEILKKLSFLLLLMGVVFSFQACTEEEPGEGLIPPTLQTESALNIQRTSVTVKGKVSGSSSSIKEYGVKYSTSKEFPADKTTKVVFDGVPSSSYTEMNLTGLTPNEQYYYCWYATTGVTEVNSNIGEFTTASTSKPLFSEFTCDSIGESYAIFSCKIDEVGDNFLMEYGVQYKQPSEKNWIPVASESIDMSTMRYSVEVRGMKAQTEYLIRAYAKNSEDETGDRGMMEGYSESLQITTLNQLSPIVTTYDVTTIGITTFTVSGVVTEATGSDGVITESGFCWSEHENPTIADNYKAVENKELGKSFSYTVTDLLPVTTYYVCAYAKNMVDGGERIGYGDIRMVTTNDLITPEVSLNNLESGTGSITASATIQNYDEGALVEKGFLWDEMDSEITYETAVKNGTYIKVEDGAKLFKSTITGLEMNASYYVRAYAIYEGSGVQQVGYSWAWYTQTRGVSFYNIDVKTSSNTATVTSGVKSVDAIAGMEVIEKGFCWKMIDESYRYEAPTLEEGNHLAYIAVTDGTVEKFSATLTNLEFAAIYAIRSYIKVKQGEEIVVMYCEGSNTFQYQGFSVGSNSSKTGNSITKRFYVHNLSELPADIVIEEVGFCWEERKENSNRTHVSELPAENKAIGTLDTNGQFEGTASNLKEGVEYWITFYIKYNGKIKTFDFGTETTATTPKIEDNQSPDLM